jgi:hypothetical protein
MYSTVFFLNTYENFVRSICELSIKRLVFCIQKKAAMSQFEFHHNTIANISHTDTYDGFEPTTLG